MYFKALYIQLLSISATKQNGDFHMKSIVALTAALFAATTAFAQAPAKKETDKDVKTVAPNASKPANAKAEPAAPTKKEEKKDAAKK